jgi:glycopeptide antibiotics resistance protein
MDTVLRELRYPTLVFGRALVLIVIVWFVIACVRLRRMEARRASVLSVAEALLAASLAAIFAFTIVQVRVLLPGERADATVANLIPVIPIVQGLASFEADITAFNALGNVLLFVPLGAALVWRFELRTLHVVVIALVGSIAIEGFQAVAALGRSVDIDDVLLNVCGALVGALVMRFLLGHVAAMSIDPFPVSTTTTPS